MKKTRKYKEVLDGTGGCERGVRRGERNQKEIRQRGMGEQGDTCWGRGERERWEKREDIGRC